MKGITRRVALAAAAVLAAYWILVNGALMTPLAQALINRIDPELVEIHYERAWSIVPLRVHVRGFRMRYQDDRVRLALGCDEGKLDVRPLRSLLKRQFVATRVQASGVELRVQVRRDRPKGPLPDAVIDTLVGVELTHLSADVREVWIDDYRYDGRVLVNGGFMFQPFRRFRLDQTALSIEDGALSFASQAFATKITGVFDLSAREMDVSVFEREALRGLSLNGRLAANVEHVGFLNAYFREVPVRLERGSGRLAIALRLQDGIVGEGSSLALDTKKVLVRFPYFFAEGGGQIRWTARKRTAWLDVAVRDVSVTQESDRRTYLEGPLIRVTAESNGLDLATPLDATVLVDLNELRAKDLTFLNEYIPTGTGVAITGGEGLIRGHLELEAFAQRGRGILDIDGRALGMKNKEAKLKGRLTVRGVLKDLNLRTQAADFSGSTIAIDDVVIDNGHGDVTKKFWLRLIADPCELRRKDEQKWRAGLGVSFSSLWPVMQMISNNVKVPWVVRAFSDIEDIRAQASLIARDDRLELHYLDLKAGILHARGDVTIVESGGELQDPYGALLVQAGAIKVGVELEGKKSRGILVDAERWYEERQRSGHGGVR